MSPFIEEFLFDIVFTGFYQAAFALGLVGPVLLLTVYLRRLNLARALRRFALFNVFLFSWSAVGNFLWLRLTWGRIAVLDDAPVWASFLPFGRYLLEHAAGGRGGWHLLGDTTMTQLRVFWVSTAIPVWLFTIASMYIYLRTYAAERTEQVT